MGLKDKDIVRKEDENKRLTTLSASEIKNIGRRLRRRRRIETAIVLILILGALLFIFSSFGSADAVKVPDVVSTCTTSAVVLPISNNQTDLQELAEDPQVQYREVRAEHYLSFGVDFYRSGAYLRAQVMFEKALFYAPEHCHAQDWLKTTQKKIESIKKEKRKARGETRYMSDYANR
ncbi:hypothetical protein [Gilvibacter sediminis]|uniref:hypothetical protein n=1 Tax=Gilvibacter sediminis TaxID=379071 RepID=UPI002350B7CF|nr:hypothetical protein [Gilvibacter sediminis]MDC7998251.1 hypothetical protein [Gilvibacter sediminis]